MKIYILTFLFLFISFSVQAQEIPKTDLPDNCEGNSYRLDGLHQKAKENKILNKKSIVIIIAKLGKNESDNELNRRRLYTVSKYLNLTDGSFVTAQGSKTDGYGVIEIYINGILEDSLAVEKCEDLRVGICENTVEDTKNYQLPKPKPALKCSKKQ